MIKINTPSGVVGLVDDADASIVQGYLWHEHRVKSGTYLRGYEKGHRKRGLIYLHRLFCDPPASMEIDHKNRNGLDNRRSNLRIVNRTYNNANRRHVRGCYFEKSTQKWRTEISKNGVCYKLGRFSKLQDAIAAYRLKKSELYPQLFERIVP
jgi:hypothetical protein